MYEEGLPLTGLGSIALGGFVLDAPLLVGVGMLLVVTGLVAVRIGRRRATRP